MQVDEKTEAILARMKKKRASIYREHEAKQKLLDTRFNQEVDRVGLSDLEGNYPNYGYKIKTKESA